MLAFKPKPFEPDDAPRWNIGVERRHVAVFVGAALVAGFAIGFIVARAVVSKESPPVMATTSAATATTTPARPATAVESAPTDFHKVTRLLRADTLEVQGLGPVRMIGIETPDGKSPKEIYGKYGQSALSFIEKATQLRMSLETATRDDNLPSFFSTFHRQRRKRVEP